MNRHENMQEEAPVVTSQGSNPPPASEAQESVERAARLARSCVGRMRLNEFLSSLCMKRMLMKGGLSVENIRSGSFSSPAPTDAKTVFD